MAQQNFIKVPAKLDDTTLRGFIPISTDKVIGVKAISAVELRIYYAFRASAGNCYALSMRYSLGVTDQDAENLKDLISKQSKNPGNVETFRLVADVDHDATYAVRFAEASVQALSQIEG